MSPILGAIAGAAIGLLASWLAYVFALPYVLRGQRERLSADWRMPVLGYGVDKLASHTKIIYRYWMPVVFSVVFAAVGYYAVSDVNGVR